MEAAALNLEQFHEIVAISARKALKKMLQQ
jgi:hypothetical protein